MYLKHRGSGVGKGQSISQYILTSEYSVLQVSAFFIHRHKCLFFPLHEFILIYSKNNFEDFWQFFRKNNEI